MYKEFYGLITYPFALTPDPQFFYLSKNHRSCLQHLSKSLAQGDGFIVLTGVFGTGKTSLLHTLMQGLDEKIYSVLLVHTQVDSFEIISRNSQEPGLEITRKSHREFLAAIKHVIWSCEEIHEKIILIIDEAQNIADEVLEELLLLIQSSVYDNRIIQVILSGQPELERLLDAPKFVPFIQHRHCTCYLLPMSHSETENYIEKRLEAAGSTRPIFASLAIKQIFVYSKGIPRAVNLICNSALLFGYSYGKSKIENALIQQVMKELHLHIPDIPRDHMINHKHSPTGIQPPRLASPQTMSLPAWLAPRCGPTGRRGGEFPSVQQESKRPKRLPLITSLTGISLLGLGFVLQVILARDHLRKGLARSPAAFLDVPGPYSSQHDLPLLPQNSSQRDLPLLPQNVGQYGLRKTVQWEQTTMAYQLSLGKPFTVSLPPLQRLPEALPVKVTLDVSDSTPSWLTFNQDKLILSGTAPRHEAGKTYYLTLHARPADGPGSASQLIVSLAVHNR